MKLTKALGDLVGLGARLGDAATRGLDALLPEKIHGQVLMDGQEALLLLDSRVHARLDNQR
jgi:hypothetical protein